MTRTSILMTLCALAFVTKVYGAPVMVSWHGSGCDQSPMSPVFTDLLWPEVGAQNECWPLLEGNQSVRWSCSPNDSMLIQRWNTPNCAGKPILLSYKTNICINVLTGYEPSEKISQAYYCNAVEVGSPPIGPGPNVTLTAENTPPVYNQSLESCTGTDCLETDWLTTYYDNPACDGLPVNATRSLYMDFDTCYRVYERYFPSPFYNFRYHCSQDGVERHFLTTPECSASWSTYVLPTDQCLYSGKTGVYMMHHCNFQEPVLDKFSTATTNHFYWSLQILMLITLLAL